MHHVEYELCLFPVSLFGMCVCFFSSAERINTFPLIFMYFESASGEKESNFRVKKKASGKYLNILIALLECACALAYYVNMRFEYYFAWHFYHNAIYFHGIFSRV